MVHAAPEGDGGGVLGGKVLPEELRQVDLPRCEAAEVDELVAVVEHEELVQVARAEHAVVVDQPLPAAQAV
jgi:phosphate starvation-inducible protein PhoH